MLDPQVIQTIITKTGIIYGLIDSNTMELRYIGQTIDSLNARLQKHLTGKYGSPHFINWIQSTNVSAIMLEREPENLNEAERRWIKEMREQGARLLNISDGGNGGFVKPCSQETRAKMSASRKGHPFWGARKHTDEARANMSASHKGKPKSAEHRKAVIIALANSPAMQKYRARGKQC